MLNEAIKNQLKKHFSSLNGHFVLRAAKSQHERFSALVELLEGVASTSDHITVEVTESDSNAIYFELVRNGVELGLVFRAIPSGHEFSTLILAILNGDGLGKLPDQSLVDRIQNLNGPIDLVSYMSLSCEVCPDVLQALNQIALLNEGIRHSIVDGALYPEEVNKLGVQAVPAIYDAGQMLNSGRASLGELLDKLETKYGKKEKKITVIDQVYDVAVIGGGPAGAAAAIYSARKGLKVAMIAGKMGGQVQDTKGIENAITLDYIEGRALAADLEQRLRSHGVQIYEHRFVERLEPGKTASLYLSSGEQLKSKSTIIASGAKWRELNIPGEKEYLGRGVAFCPHCDGPYFKGKDVAVIGGGNSGVEAALDLAGIVKSVTVIEFTDSLKADEVLQNRLRETSNVSVILKAQLEEIIGDGQKVTELIYLDRENGKTCHVNTDGVFVQIGLLPNSKFVEGLLELNSKQEIKVDDGGRTNVAGIYAAGDVTSTPYKQIVISMGDGAKAALTSFEDRMRS